MLLLLVDTLDRNNDLSKVPPLWKDRRDTKRGSSLLHVPCCSLSAVWPWQAVQPQQQEQLAAH